MESKAAYTEFLESKLLMYEPDSKNREKNHGIEKRIIRRDDESSMGL